MTFRLQRSTRAACRSRGDAGERDGLSVSAGQPSRRLTRSSPCRPASRSCASLDRRWSIGPSSRTSTSAAGCTSPIRLGPNDKVEKQLADRPHRIVRLEDKDGDGVVRHQRGLRRPHDAAAGHDVVRRLAVRGSAAQHLEADRHQRRRRRGHARRVVRRQDADRRAPTICTGRISGPTGGSTGPRARLPSRRTSGPASRRW